MRVDLAACDSQLLRAAGWNPADPLATLGAIIAVVDIVEVRADQPGGRGRCTCGPWAEPGLFHWRVTAVRPLPRPVVALGRATGLWTPRDGVLAEVAAMLDLTPL